MFHLEKKLTNKSLTGKPGDSRQLHREVIDQNLFFSHWNIKADLKIIIIKLNNSEENDHLDVKLTLFHL